jgi:prepilin-type N-terminal cleavage/methylation domain-containing protein
MLFRREGADPQKGFSLLEVMASVVVVGMGIYLFMKTQGTTRRSGYASSQLKLAGHLIDRHLEDMRITIAQDTIANWPPATGVTVVESGITLVRTVSSAVSPRDGAVLSRVRKVEILTYWGPAPRTSLDTLRITTYVAKRF